MILWIFILLALFAGVIAGLIYLDRRMAGTPPVWRLAKGRRRRAILYSFLFNLLILFVSGFLLNMMNAIVIFLHILVFWVFGELVVDLYCRVKKKTRVKLADTGGKGKVTRMTRVGYVVIPFTIVYLCFGAYMDFHVCRTDYALETEKAVGTIRVAVISDSHIGATFDGAGFAAHLQTIEADHPDALLIVGDFVDDSTTKADMERACEALGEFSSTYGVFFAYGNHDKGYYIGRDFTTSELVSELERSGVKILQDESVLIDDRFYIIGRMDRTDGQRGSGRMEASALTAALDRTKYMVLLDHQPSDYENEADCGADLVISGHTHGGQIFPLNKIGRWTGVSDQVYGYERRGETDFIVTSGISDWSIIFKTGCRSEYLMIEVDGR